MCSTIALGVLAFVALAYFLGPERAARVFGGCVRGVANLLALFVRLCSELWRNSPGLRAAFRRPGARERVLSPGDAAPLPGQVGDHFDYRGVAVEREIAPLLQGGLRLGRYLRPSGQPGANVYLPPEMLERNCAVIGPPGSGKTESVVIPWIEGILSSGASAVTIDVKGDLADRLSRSALQMGARWWYWSISDPARSMSWNWLDGVADERGRQAAVQSILGRPSPHDNQPFFHERDCRWLRACIEIVKLVQGPEAQPRSIYKLVASDAVMAAAFEHYPETRRLRPEVSDLVGLGADERSRAVSGLLNALHLFSSQEIRSVTERSDFGLADICSRPTLLVIGASLADARASEVMSSIMISQLLAQVYRRFDAGGARTARPLYLIIDEAPRLKTRIDYAEVLSVARSARVGICLAAQDVSQFGDEREASGILSNCLTFICLRGVSAETARYFSGRLGNRADVAVEQGVNRGPRELVPGQHFGYQNVSLPVLDARAIMHPPFDTYSGIVHVSPVSPKPFLVDLAFGCSHP